MKVLIDADDESDKNNLVAKAEDKTIEVLYHEEMKIGYK